MSGRRLATALHAAALLLGAAACGRGAPEAGPRHHRVLMRGGAFIPASLVVAVGDTITWRNDDVVPHTATGAEWDSGELGAGAAHSHVVRAADLGRYTCRYHPAMVAALVAAAP